MKLIVANWKSNPLTKEEAEKLAKETDRDGVVICPPDIFLEDIKKTLRNATLGAQDVFWGNLGAYTGEISWKQLVEIGVEYVIIGHSERRKYLSETDELINNKVLAALEAGLKVILCVGEPIEVREKGINHAKLFIEQQLDKDLIGIKEPGIQKSSELIIAYEPIWAIGTGEADTPESASEISTHIKSILSDRYSISPKVLYGGSVKLFNAKEFFESEGIDGALIGGASLNSKEFNQIVDLS